MGKRGNDVRTYEMNDNEKRILAFEDKLIKHMSEQWEIKHKAILREILGEYESNTKRIDIIDLWLGKIIIKNVTVYLFPIFMILALLYLYVIK